MTTTKRLTATLHDRSITFDPAEWPKLGHISGGHECGQYSQNGSTWWRLTLRQHVDGRLLALLTTGGLCQCVHGFPADSGHMFAAGTSRSSIAAALRELIQIGYQAGDDKPDPESDVRMAMALLPAEEL